MTKNKVFKWEDNRKNPIVTSVVNEDGVIPPDWFGDWLDNSGTDYPIQHLCEECDTVIIGWQRQECKCETGPKSIYVCSLCGMHVGNDTRDDYFHLLISHEDAIIMGRLSR